MKNKLMPLLIVLLIGAAFAVGSMWTELRYLKSGQQNPQMEQNEGQLDGQPSAAGEAEVPEPEILTDEDWQKLITNPSAVKGNLDAPVTIVEFSEYECPFCKRYVDDTYSQIMADYADQVRYIFRDYPLAFHAHAKAVALAARCAGEQDAYWDYHDVLFAKRDDWAELESVDTRVIDFAQELGLDEDQFSDCYSSQKYQQAVDDDFALGQQMGVSGTPTFFINGKKLVGAHPYENFKELIDEALK
ncbi:thioredoxin domain-containing protein [Patescibacteria group bacterium]|nr:thioredoxin domain-containing protein [Patescibacteria group bacterium]MBU1931362.1 thioredoxin domain-containing protein [Patescibacteria group bacterium]